MEMSLYRDVSSFFLILPFFFFFFLFLRQETEKPGLSSEQECEILTMIATVTPF